MHIIDSKMVLNGDSFSFSVVTERNNSVFFVTTARPEFGKKFVMEPGL